MGNEASSGRAPARYGDVRKPEQHGVSPQGALQQPLQQQAQQSNQPPEQSLEAAAAATRGAQAATPAVSSSVVAPSVGDHPFVADSTLDRHGARQAVPALLFLPPTPGPPAQASDDATNTVCRDAACMVKSEQQHQRQEQRKEQRQQQLKQQPQ